jgi:hypothetical protein
MSKPNTSVLEYIPGIFAYSIGAYICTASRVFIWKIASHWSKIWVANANQGDSQILALTFVITLLLVFGISVFIWSIASHINYKSTEKSFLANGSAGIAIALAISQDDWLNQIAASTTYAS